MGRLAVLGAGVEVRGRAVAPGCRTGVVALPGSPAGLYALYAMICTQVDKRRAVLGTLAVVMVGPQYLGDDPRREPVTGQVRFAHKATAARRVE